MLMKQVEDLSVQEIRYLLIKKRQVARVQRLDRFRSSGKVIEVLSAETKPAFKNTATLSEKPHQTWLDRFLLVIEVLALIGLLGMVLNGFSILTTLNRSV